MAGMIEFGTRKTQDMGDIKDGGSSHLVPLIDCTKVDVDSDFDKRAVPLRRDRKSVV